MPTKYFILSKPKTDKPHQDDNNQLVFLNNHNQYILPHSIFDYYSQNGLFEKHLIDWCSQFCSLDTNFLDIGAHTGTYSISLAPFSKRVLAFEPQKMSFYALCGSVALSNIHNIDCFQYALGSIEQVGKITLNIVSNDGGGSTIHPSTSTFNTETISLFTLDHIYNSLDTSIGFIKMDVEENELFVLQGGLNTILLFKPIILFEANSFQPSLWDFFTYTLGYSIIAVSGTNNMFLASPIITL